ncbi:hypothetical protein KDK_81150 [Dictyobacter kobayashii]|uniref:Uncharacterized protein n=1 Tax=Dictyobacter kobayashii TaxID=2014872 RepID=A0A402AZ32_9CHLR|nr:hypothetical protein KDK_81150 [Dictyobacter kobayashii]
MYTILNYFSFNINKILITVILPVNCFNDYASISSENKKNGYISYYSTLIAYQAMHKAYFRKISIIY